MEEDTGLGQLGWPRPRTDEKRRSSCKERAEEEAVRRTKKKRLGGYTHSVYTGRSSREVSSPRYVLLPAPTEVSSPRYVLLVMF